MENKKSKRSMLLVANVSKEHVRKFYIPFIALVKEKGWTIDVACRLDLPIPECDCAYDLPCDRNPFRGGIKKSVDILKEILKDHDYDILLCTTVVGSIVARLAASSFRKKGLNVIYLCHGLHFFPGASLTRWLMGYPVEKLLASKTDVMIITNDTDGETAKKHLNIPVVQKSHSMGVNLDKFRNVSFSKEEYAEKREALGLTSDDFVLTYVAEIIENKNQTMLIRALELIQKTIPNCKLMLVGPEHDDGLLKKKIAEKNLQNSVFLLGWRNDVPELLHLSDVYVASSKSEGLGLNLIEAMACDLPVVATNNRGHLEVVKNSLNAFVVDINDYEKMAEYVIELYRDVDLRNKFVQQAQKDIEKYKTDAAIHELVEMILSHINKTTS